MNIFYSAKKRIITISIESLKKRLTDSDYKVIKCVECSLTGEDAPYDIEALHAERQAQRDRINALEAEMAAIEAGDTL